MQFAQLTHINTILFIKHKKNRTPNTTNLHAPKTVEHKRKHKKSSQSKNTQKIQRRTSPFVRRSKVAPCCITALALSSARTAVSVARAVSPVGGCSRCVAMNADDYETLPTQRLSAHMAAGAIAGVMEHCVMYPLDSVKVSRRPRSPYVNSTTAAPHHHYYYVA